MTTSIASSPTAASGSAPGRTEFRALSRAEIFSAVPPTSSRARTQAQWLEALARDPELVALRSDRQRNIREAARILARYADWRERTTRPTRALVCRLCGFSVSTWKVCRAWLEDHGYLGLVRAGRTPWLRPGVLADPDAQNEAAIYVLGIPRSKTARRPAPAPPTAETRPLSPSDRTEVNVPAHAESQDQDIASARAETHFKRSIARVARITAGESITEGWVGYLVRPYLAAGWAWRDLHYAVDHEPGGAPYRLSLKAVRSPRAWLAWRLSRWIGPDGSPIASPTELRAIGAQAAADEQRARRSARAELEARRVDPAPYAARIRAELAARRLARGRNASALDPVPRR